MASEDIVIRFIIDDKRFKGQMDKVTNKLGFFEKKAKTANRAFSSFVGNLSANLVSKAFGNISNGIQKIVSDTADFEQALTGVAKTTNLAGTELQALGSEIQALGKEIPVAAVELLNIAQIAAQLGVRGTANIVKFTDTVARLAITTDLTSETAALGLARLLNLTGESADQSEKLGSVIVELGNNFATLESNILRNSTEIARSTVEFGLASEEVAGIATALSALGVPAEIAGSAVGRAFIDISKSITEGGQKLEEFAIITGLTKDELKKNFERDAVGVFQKFIDGAKRLEGQGQKISTTLGNVGLNSIRLTKTLTPLIQRNEILADTMRSAREEAGEVNALFEESSIQTDTLKNDFKLLVNAIERVNVSIGNLRKSGLRDFLGGLEVIFAKIENRLNKNSSDPYIRGLAELNEKVEQAGDALIFYSDALEDARGTQFEDATIRSMDQAYERLQILNAEVKRFQINAEKPPKGITELENEIFHVNKAIALLNVEAELLNKTAGSKAQRVAISETITALEKQLAAQQKLKETGGPSGTGDNEELKQTAAERNLILLGAEQALLQAKEDLSNEELVRIQERVDKEYEIREQALIDTRKLLDDGKVTDSKAEAEFDKKILNLQAQKIKRTNDLVKESTKQKVADIASSFNSLADIAALGGKKTFEVMKKLQIASATVSGFAAIQAALAAPPGFPYNIAGVLAATAKTATNLAGINAQNFAQGGIVPGTSFSGDNVVANVNSAEMILNREQQGRLFDIANGAEGSGGSKETVVHATVEIDGEAIGKAVSRQVADGLKLGENI